MDSTIPRKRLADILLAIQEMEKKYQLRCANVFHAGDGNLHPLILFDANDPTSCTAASCSAPTSWRPAWPWAAR
jgi:FAD/FMN-containing dehydrogenase